MLVKFRFHRGGNFGPIVKVRAVRMREVFARLGHRMRLPWCSEVWRVVGVGYEGPLPTLDLK